MCVPYGLWLEEKEGTDGARGLLGARVSALCFHRHWKQWTRNAAAQLGGQGAWLIVLLQYIYCNCSLKLLIIILVLFFCRIFAQQKLCTFLTRTNVSTSCCQWKCFTGIARISVSSSANESRSSPNLPKRSSHWRMQTVSQQNFSSMSLNERFDHNFYSTHFLIAPSMHSFWDEGGSLQPLAVSDCQYAVPSRGRGKLSC